MTDEIENRLPARSENTSHFDSQLKSGYWFVYCGFEIQYSSIEELNEKIKRMQKIADERKEEKE